PQTRLFFRSSGALAREAYSRLETEFEEDGLPLALIEIDEAQDIHEISVYAPEHPDKAMSRMRAVMSFMADAPKIAVEELPEIDWVSYSLAGLRAVRSGRFFVHGSHE